MVLDHITHVREEYRYGMRRPEYRALCKCGYQDKALTEQDANNLCAEHKRRAGRS